MSAGAQQAALLIDADNFADAKALEAAWEQLKFYAGRVNICRAYGGAVRLQALAEALRNIGARPVVNLPLDKNTTDAALMADAVALHFQQGVRLFAIASGDADFAPLAVRLREWGCQVWCFSMNGILFKGAEAYYDRIVRFSPAVPAPVPDLPVAVVKPVALVSAASLVPSAPTQLDAPRQMPLPSAPAPTKAAPNIEALPDEVARILKAVPSLHHEPQMLSQVVPVLRQKMILGKTTKSTTFFARYAAYFKLSPAHQPMQLAYTPLCTVSPVVTKKSTLVGAPLVAAAALSWPVNMPRRPAPPLMTELHGLRSALGQVALRRVSVADVLLAAPEMLKGQWCSLAAVAGRLREKGLLLPQQSALRILERHPLSFSLQVERMPQTVRYLRSHV